MLISGLKGLNFVFGERKMLNSFVACVEEGTNYCTANFLDTNLIFL